MGPKPKPEPNDSKMLMSWEQLEQEEERLKEKRREANMKRNFVQQERDLINTYYETGKIELEETMAKIEKEEYEMEKLNEDHQAQINAFINKYKHLEYDHDVFINATLLENSEKAARDEEATRLIREELFLQQKELLKKEIKDNTGVNRDYISDRQNNHDLKYKKTKAELEAHLKEIQEMYKKKIQQLEEDLELRLKVDIHELEERKNLHISNLLKAFEEKMDNWKKENIQQIRENIQLIKTNSENLKLLKEENESLEKEVEKNKKEIHELEKKYEAAKQEHSEITNSLAKYYNQDINMKNMNIKISQLKKKCEETIKKTKDVETKKEELTKEIIDLKKKFIEAIKKFKERAEYKNYLLDEHINQLNETYSKREMEIEEILKEVDNVAGMDSSNSQGVFGREMINEMMENIRGVLITKTQIIKNLKYSLHLATKAYNDTIRVYEAKLIEFGLPPEELGFQLLESITSKMPAGLVSA